MNISLDFEADQHSYEGNASLEQEWDGLQDLINLGTIEGDVIAFGGAVSNAHALEAFRRTASFQATSAGQRICTGDVVAYCGQPAETVGALRSLDVTTIRGNCEESLAECALDCGCGFDVGSTCNLLSVAWYSHANTSLSSGDRRWMASPAPAGGLSRSWPALGSGTWRGDGSEPVLVADQPGSGFCRGNRRARSHGRASRCSAGRPLRPALPS
jgi:hypothetical protein